MRCKHLEPGRHSRGKQRGAALILVMFLIGLSVAAYTIKAFNLASLQSQRDQETMEALGDAKDALIAWSVTHSELPGLMPYPDREDDPAGYDGKSDCPFPGTAFSYGFLLGQLPVYGQTNPCASPQDGLGGNWQDAQGNRLWYAVSRNLVQDYELAVSDPSFNPIINPGFINAPYTDPPYRRRGHTTGYRWLIVRDRNGNVISDRVAVVIIAPGLPLTTQDRSAAAPEATEFLDSLQIGATVYSNQDYDSDEEDFILGDDSYKLSPLDTTYQLPYNFNDKLVFITIDELMAAVDKRAAATAIDALEEYRSANGNFPLAAQLGTTSQYACEPSKYEGFLPLDNHTCTKTRISSSSSSFSCSAPSTPINTGITSVRFRENDLLLDFLSDSGACVANGDSCTCTGAGSCSELLNLFSFNCDADLNCNATGTSGSYRVNGGKFSTSTSSACTVTLPTKTAAGCTNSNSVVNCTSSGTTSFSTCGDAYFGATLPAWFRGNNWQDYTFYTRSTSSPGNIIAGGKTQLDALLITTGRPVDSAPFADSKPSAAQVTPSCDALNNYLDSIENANADNVYDGITQPRTRNYNDQVFIVAP
jgi:hypothetical protein